MPKPTSKWRSIVRTQLVGRTRSAVLQAAIADCRLPLDKDFLRCHLIALVRGYLHERGMQVLQSGKHEL
jgi:hypothetical protein